MIRRLFWLGVGLGVGALVVRKATKTAEAFTPTGISRSLQTSAADLLDTVRGFVEEVREGMAERESELYTALAADLAGGQQHRGDPS
ncbi:MAG TPA: DUF6167 family protein [Mycobacteriales bacterium]